VLDFGYLMGAKGRVDGGWIIGVIQVQADLLFARGWVKTGNSLNLSFG
jgi:hypothetical protein